MLQILFIHRAYEIACYIYVLSIYINGPIDNQLHEYKEKIVLQWQNQIYYTFFSLLNILRPNISFLNKVPSNIFG